MLLAPSPPEPQPASPLAFLALLLALCPAELFCLPPPRGWVDAAGPASGNSECLPLDEEVLGEDGGVGPCALPAELGVVGAQFIESWDGLGWYLIAMGRDTSH